MARAVLPAEPATSQEGKRASKGTAPPEAERKCSATLILALSMKIQYF